MCAGRLKVSARVRANRRNAAKSTGPRTPAGKARSARNAQRHGLAVAIEGLDDLEWILDPLAREIAGAGAEEEKLERARDLVRAQIDVLRIRRARFAILSDPRERQKGARVKHVIAVLELFSRPGFSELLDSDADTDEEASDSPTEDALQHLHSLHESLVTGPVQVGGTDPDLIAALPILLPKLERIDRYLNRALARRCRALEIFLLADVARAPDAESDPIQSTDAIKAEDGRGE